MEKKKKVMGGLGDRKVFIEERAGRPPIDEEAGYAIF